MWNKTQLFILLSLTPVLSHAQVLEDPTRPARIEVQPDAIQQGTAVALKLEAVMQTGDNRVAVINGKTLKAGQRIQGAIIKDIQPRSVVVAQEDNGVWKTMTLWVTQSGSVKTNTAENY